MKNNVTHSHLAQIINYDPDTGRLIWLPRPAFFFRSNANCNAWNARYAGTLAFTSLDRKGYLIGSIFGTNYRAHRIAWTLHTGNWPACLIDHINGDRADNRFSNLREATIDENSRNRRCMAGSTSQFLGVSRDRKNGRWRAQIQHDGRKHFIGFYQSESDAAAAYQAEAKRMHGAFAYIHTGAST